MTLFETKNPLTNQVFGDTVKNKSVSERGGGQSARTRVARTASFVLEHEHHSRLGLKFNELEQIINAYPGDGGNF